MRDKHHVCRIAAGPAGSLTSLGVFYEAVLRGTDEPDQQVLPGRVQVRHDDVIGRQLHTTAFLDLDVEENKQKKLCKNNILPHKNVNRTHVWHCFVSSTTLPAGSD